MSTVSAAGVVGELGILATHELAILTMHACPASACFSASYYTYYTYTTYPIYYTCLLGLGLLQPILLYLLY